MRNEVLYTELVSSGRVLKKPTYAFENIKRNTFKKSYVAFILA